MKLSGESIARELYSDEDLFISKSSRGAIETPAKYHAVAFTMKLLLNANNKIANVCKTPEPRITNFPWLPSILDKIYEALKVPA